MTTTLRRSFLLGMIPALCAMAWPKAVSAHPLDNKNHRVLTLTTHDTDTLVRTLYGECRGECEDGQIAVAHVVFNRVLSTEPSFSCDRTVAEACHRPDQFSCWQKERHELWALRRHDREYITLLNVVHLALHKHYAGADYSRHATYFAITAIRPEWSLRMRRTVRIGHHSFYRPLTRIY